MRRMLVLVAASATLAACGSDRLTPAPGQAPGWPSQSPPRPSYAPLPFTDNYLPSSAVQVMPAVAPGQNVPYAVPPGAGPVAAPAAAAAAAPAPAPAPATAATPDQVCHKVPPVNFEGRQASTVCPQPDGTWVYIPD